MINYKEIFDAWKASFNPTPAQEELAKKRLDVCMGCEYREELLSGVKWSALCNHCGCPLNKKVFSTTYNACTKKKWGDVDSEYLQPIPDKDKKSLI
jgi:PHP family Zn ribbon phosphoesterase